MLTLNQILVIIVLGAIITILISLKYFPNLRYQYKFVLSIIPEVLYIAQIIILSQTEVITISDIDFKVLIDTRMLYLFFIVIPILIIIRTTYLYIIFRREARLKLIVLYSIEEMRKSNSKLPLGKYIKKNINIKEQEKKLLLRQLPLFLNQFKKANHFLISKNKRFFLTEKAKTILTQNIRLIKDIAKFEIIPKNLETWTEEELIKYAKSRGLN